MPSAVGYQPNLGTEVAQLEERIASTRDGAITSIQAVYVPADDLTDPAPAAIFAHLDCKIVLSRQIAELGIYPAVDPWIPLPGLWTPGFWGKSIAAPPKGRRRSSSAIKTCGILFLSWVLMSFPMRTSLLFPGPANSRDFSPSLFCG